MTDPKHTEPVVTQADREAAADLALWLFDEDLPKLALALVADKIRKGASDRMPPVQAFARHRTAAEAASRAEVERLREALTRHNLRAANGDEITVADEMEQAAGTLEAFVVADKEHSLLDCTDNDGVEYQSAWMAGLMDHATINARTLRKWAASLRAALSAAAKGGAA